MEVGHQHHECSKKNEDESCSSQDSFSFEESISSTDSEEGEDPNKIAM